VLRPDGTFWLNIGDSYNGGTGGGGQGKTSQRIGRANVREQRRGGDAPGMKQKDRMGIPHRLVFALQDDGWFWRDEIIWYSPNKMPESCRDRCTKAHEFIFMLTKSPRYFYDLHAIRERAKSPIQPRLCENGLSVVDGKKERKTHNCGVTEFSQKRSVWTINTEGNRENHFAAYPKKLVLPCILAGTSAKGCCPECGAPWRRVLERKRTATRPGKNTKVTGRAGGCDGESGEHSADGRAQFRLSSEIVGNRDPERHVTTAKTVGWEPSCSCIKRYSIGHGDYEETTPEPVPCTVLDCFGGTGTTAAVALANGRRAITMDLNPEYVEFIKKKTACAIQKRGFCL
jgi:DNA modification methylase